MLRLKKHFCILVVMLGVVGGLLASSPAEAASYRVLGTGGVGLRLRSGPGTSYSTIKVLPEGASIDIICQTKGESVHGSAIWDKLSSGGYVSDYYTSTPVYANYSPGIPNCGVVNRPPTGREQRAVAWAQSQLGSSSYLGWCDRFVANAYGQARSGYASAKVHLQAVVNRGQLHRGDYYPPPGALVFYYAGSRNGGFGHVMLSIGGGAAISSEDWINGKRYGVSIVSTRDGDFGSYAGWSWADSGWKGR